MPLSNCKTELKLKWTKYYVLAAAGANNTDANLNNIIFTIKNKKIICSSCNFIDKRQSKIIITS